MKITVSTSQVANELMSDTNANWSRAGSFALAEYLEQYEADSGEEIELDVCAIRCDFSEHSSLQDWAHQYFSNALDDDEVDSKIREYIEDHGTLIEFEGGIIVSSF
jgi:hypothetical protein